jgi:probable phosphoglycerate mutase
MDEFGEVHMGEWEGLSMKELAERQDWKRFNAYRSGGGFATGEFMIEVQTRMVRQLHNIEKHHPDETVAVISHGDPLRSVIAYYLGIPLDLLVRFEIAPASVSVLKSAEWGPLVLCLNETGEVPV